MSKIRVRIAPSPTGDPHVGTAYIGLFNMVFARSGGGRFVLRIEDTDRQRSTPEAEKAIFDSLKWLGLEWDEGPDIGGNYGPYRQSERLEIYNEYIRKLVDAGAAYYCFCSSERLAELREQQKKAKKDIGYDGHCRELPADEVSERLERSEPHVVRLKVPQDTRKIDFTDKIRGKVTFDARDVRDQVLMKSDGFPTYHLANVVDDHLMGITHVIRAEEWISSVPRHVLLYRAFGWQPPVYVHMPLLRNKDKSKISKRKNPVSLDYYRRKGYLPEAMLNFLGNLGWSMSDAREEFTLQEMIEDFAWDRVTPSGPVFDVKKLDWLNGAHIRKLSIEDLLERIRPYSALPIDDVPPDKLRTIISIVQERLRTLSQFDEMVTFLFADKLDYEADLLVQKKQTPGEAVECLEACRRELPGPDEWKTEPIETAAREICKKLDTKAGKLFMNLRIAITGTKVSPPLCESMEVLGREKCIERIGAALDKLT